MLLHLLSLTARILRRDRVYTLLNVVGLAVGLGCTLLIVLWVQDELSYDRFHRHADRLFRVEHDYGRVPRLTSSSSPEGPVFLDRFPEVVHFTRFAHPGGSVLVRAGERAAFETRFAAVDSVFFEMFTFPFVAGDPATALQDPYSVVLTRTLARRYFGDTPALGRTLLIDNAHLLTVTGIIDDPPTASTLRFDLVIPFDFLAVLGRHEPSWASHWLDTYVQLAPTASAESVGRKMTDLVRTEGGRRYENLHRVVLAPLAGLHLGAYAYTGSGFERRNLRYVSLFSVLALFVLVIAAINFVNLSTARATRRAREIGIRKAVGARRGLLILQFLIESIALTALALVLALVLALPLLGPFNALTEKTFTPSTFLRARVWIPAVALALGTGLAAGSYPAFFLSSFRPIRVLRGALRVSPGAGRLRQVLVVFQFGVSIVLAIGTTVLYAQMRYMQDLDLGYAGEQVLYVPLQHEAARAGFETLRTAWLSQPAVASVSAAQLRPSFIGWNSFPRWDGQDPDQRVAVHHNRVDFEYLETLDVAIVAGRSFSRDFPGDVTTDGRGSFIINEEAARLIGRDDVLGLEFSLGGTTGPIVGVMEDVHFASLHSRIGPLALILSPPSAAYALLRLRPGQPNDAVEDVREAWERVLPDFPFAYGFLDDDVDRLYRTEHRLGLLLGAFAGVAVAIACLGLFGLAAYTAASRQKELAVRKVLGATSVHLTLLLCRDFAGLVALANLAAWPIAALVMQQWLATFAYRTGMPWGLFPGIGLAALGLALLTVSMQALRAAFAHPAVVLRQE